MVKSFHQSVLNFSILLLIQAIGNDSIFMFNEETAELRVHSASVNGSLNYLNLLLIDRRLPVKFLVHGYNQRNSDYLFNVIVMNYVQKGNVTLITVDYPRTAFIPYADCYAWLPTLESYIAEFIQILNFLGIPASNIHLIGHSLGGQIVGRIGNVYSSISRGTKLGRVSSLDPAKIGFESVLVPLSSRIHSQSAEVVDVVHTDTQTIAITHPVGTIDYYVNRGLSPQPGCIANPHPPPLIENIPRDDGWIIPLNVDGRCSHGRSLVLWAQSILLPDSLVGRECDDWDPIKRMCITIGTENAIYGEHMPLELTGIYFLNTTSTPPYISISF